MKVLTAVGTGAREQKVRQGGTEGPWAHSSQARSQSLGTDPPSSGTRWAGRSARAQGHRYWGSITIAGSVYFPV